LIAIERQAIKTPIHLSEPRLSMEKPRDTGKQKVRSAEVGTDILKALAELSPATSLSRLAEHVQMPASKVHRYLQALIASGFAEQNAATNHYGLGREALRVGLAALGSMDVLKVGALPLAELRDQLNETCFLAVWGNQGATVVQIEPAVRAVTVVTQLGSVLPLLSSSTGLVFSAFLPSRETVELRPRPGGRPGLRHHVPTDPPAWPAFCAWLADAGGGRFVGAGVQRRRPGGGGNDRGRPHLAVPRRRRRPGGPAIAGGDPGGELAHGLSALIQSCH
jgi:DNA-binding IclR family transcriptional regulator